MLNETASSTEDRPALRSSLRVTASADDSRHNELRDMVATVLTIEDETFEPDAAWIARDQVFLMNTDSRFVASFTGQLMLDSETAYSQLDSLLKPINDLPVFRLVEGRHVIHIIEGRTDPKPRAWWINAVLFVVTLFSVLILGTEVAISEIAATDLAFAETLLPNFFLELWRGLPYAISILLILGAHELGHYFAARHHKLAVTLPYFIPAPFISFLGTFGAFIQLREPMRNRKMLLDVGAAGPLAGLLFAIPILLIGLATSPVQPIAPSGILEGNSLLYALAKILVFGEFLPNGAEDVYINQLARAGWAGLLVTALNLIPLGQLDGGHILYSLVGRHARKLYYPLIGVAVLLIIETEFWILWVLLLLLFGRTYAVPLDTITPLDNRRKFIAVLALVLFVFIFVPVPLTVIDAGNVVPAPRDSAFLLPTLTAVGILVWQRLRR